MPADLPAYWRHAAPRNLEAPTFGPRADVCMKALGTPAMPHQAYINSVAGEHDGTGRMAYQFVIVTMPRRGGKTAALGGNALERMLRMPDHQVYFTAQSQQDAGERFDELVKLMKRSPLADSTTFRFAAGSKRFTLPNDSSFRIFKPRPDAVHGNVVGTGMIDEAFDLDDEQGHGIIGAIRPAQLTMNGRGQIWIVSTRGTSRSTFLNYWIDQGRQGAPGVALFDIGAPVDADPFDPETWKLYHPAHGLTLTTEDLSTEASVMDPSEFRRAYLNLETATKSTLIDPQEWATWSADFDPPARPVTLTFDVAHGRAAATIMATWQLEDGRTAHKIVAHQPGTDWVVPKLLEVIDRVPHSVVGADDGGDARQVTDQLRREHVHVETLSGRDIATAYGAWMSRLATDQLRHDGTEAFAAAAAALTTRPVGDLTAPSRRHSPGDISPVVAAIVGHWLEGRHYVDNGPLVYFGATAS